MKFDAFERVFEKLSLMSIKIRDIVIRVDILDELISAAT